MSRLAGCPAAPKVRLLWSVIGLPAKVFELLDQVLLVDVADQFVVQHADHDGQMDGVVGPLPQHVGQLGAVHENGPHDEGVLGAPLQHVRLVIQRERVGGVAQAGVREIDEVLDLGHVEDHPVEVPDQRLLVQARDLANAKDGFLDKMKRKPSPDRRG